MNWPETSSFAMTEEHVAFSALQNFTSDEFKLYVLLLGRYSAPFGACASFVTPLD